MNLLRRFSQLAGQGGFLAALSAALLCAACNKSARPRPFPVHGQVLFQGKPTPNAVVVFHPLDNAAAKQERPVGRVNEDGSFRLTTYGENDGAPEGDYAVTVEWRRAARAPNGEFEPGPNVLPVRYSKPATSTLRVRVTPAENELTPFQLKR
jgi:hypothetical protein